MKVFVAGTKTAGKLCSICQSDIIAGEQICYCPDCGLPFHHECWEENGGCSAYGCASAPETPKTDAAAGPVSSVWGGEKPCPACGRSIKAQALKCRFCGALFGTRDYVDPDEFAGREYEGRQYVSARNKVTAVFLLTATGCLSWLGAAILGTLIFRGRAFGLEYRRLPGALKCLAACGFGIGCLLMLILVLLLLFD
jgi:hypothetical protein